MTATLPTRPATPAPDLGSRITPALLDRLSARVVTTGPRDPVEVESPATGQPLGTVPRGTPEDVAEAARRARAAQVAWAATPVEQRAEVLLRFAELVMQRQDEVLDLIQLENGKARRHAFEEIFDVAQVCRYYGRRAPRLLHARRRAGALPVLTRTWEMHHPKGVVGIISPWNYPLTLGISDALPALVAGNAVLAKPDQLTPFTALWAAEVLEHAGLPRDVLQVVTGSGSQLGPEIIRCSDFLMFTGSTTVGRTVAAQAAERLIDFSMELGGKNAILVLPDVNVVRAVAGAVRAAFSNTGQLCVSMERMFVHTDVYDRFLPRFVQAARGLALGHSLDYRPDLGSLISRSQLEAVDAHVQDAVAKGATVLAGGRARPDVGPCFYEPTILTDTTPDMTLYSDETFGPVISVFRVGSLDEAVARANDTTYGLNASVWTRDTRHARQIARRLQSGTVNVNEGYAAAWGSVDAPMGGWKDSGFGSRHGEYGLLKYTDAQNVAVQRLLPLEAPPFVSASAFAKGATAALRLRQKLPGRM